MTVWLVPLVYAVGALAAGLTFPRFEARIFPNFISPMSVSSAIGIYSSIASGMIALTGIVFSLTFLMVQFSATAYSPRLVLWIARDPVMSHALGVFTATFLYAVAAISGVDRSGSGRVPMVSVLLELGLLLISVAMFVALIQRIGLLQINRMLVFTGDQGRNVIENLPRSAKAGSSPTVSDQLRAQPPTQILIHHGRPRAIQSIDGAALGNLAKGCGGVIEMKVAIGDTVVELTPLLQVYGAERVLDERELRNAMELGSERTFEQDPKYAIRLLVDIAIRALSPAINDPTTGVQALDQIEDLLLRLGLRPLDIGDFRDDEGKLRLIVPFPTWEDFLLLGLDEIRSYGATSVQIMRRMKALVRDLMAALPEERHPALHHWEGRIDRTIARSFAEAEEQQDASIPDRQGLGVPNRPR